MLQLYKNIKKRRLELQLTQTDLATKLGYADNRKRIGRLAAVKDTCFC